MGVACFLMVLVLVLVVVVLVKEREGERGEFFLFFLFPSSSLSENSQNQNRKSYLPDESEQSRAQDRRRGPGAPEGPRLIRQLGDKAPLFLVLRL